MGTSYLYTAGPASLVGGLLGDWLGRRRTLLLCWPLLLAGYLALPLAPTLMWILPSRILSALGSWLSYSCGSILIAEFAHPSLRGTLCSLPSVFLAVGMLVTYTLGALLPWRLMSWLLLAQPPFLLLLLLIIPESPQWLALQGQAEKARASLVWVRGSSWKRSSRNCWQARGLQVSLRGYQHLDQDLSSALLESLVVFSSSANTQASQPWWCSWRPSLQTLVSPSPLSWPRSSSEQSGWPRLASPPSS